MYSRVDILVPRRKLLVMNTKSTVINREMFYVGCAKNIFTVFGEQNDDYQTNSQVTISMSTNRKGHVSLIYY